MVAAAVSRRRGAAGTQSPRHHLAAVRFARAGLYVRLRDGVGLRASGLPHHFAGPRRGLRVQHLHWPLRLPRPGSALRQNLPAMPLRALEAGPMSTTAPPGSSIPLPPLPKCPYCEADMPTINGYPYMLGRFTVLSVSCSSCRTALHFQIFQNPPEEGGPKVQIPS